MAERKVWGGGGGGGWKDAGQLQAYCELAMLKGEC